MNCDKNTWGGRMLYSLSSHFDFSLDEPYDKLSKQTIDLLLYGTKGKEFPIAVPPKARQGTSMLGR